MWVTSTETFLWRTLSGYVVSGHASQLPEQRLGDEADKYDEGT